MRKIICVSMALVLCWAATAVTAAKPDKFGKPDKITVEIAPLAKGRWVVGVLLDNDEALAAITVPLKFGNRVGQFKLDSVCFDNTRTSYFALKTSNSYDTLNSVLVGLLYTFADERPPLEPGIGPVARLYFTHQGKAEDAKLPPAIDSTFFPPYNTLELVTPSAEPITPIFETKLVEKLTEYKPPPKKTPAPGAKTQ